MLSIRNFSKSYSGNLIIEIPKFDFQSGIYWVKGENGSGKTTFFKALAGMHPCQGEVKFTDDISLHEHPVDFRRHINYTEAEPVYPGFLTARDLIHFIGKAKKSPQEQQHLLVNRFGIDKYVENACDTYSSGMIKKVSLAIAFLGAPRLIILDEPLITLDEFARKILFELMDEYITTYKSIILLSSHQLLENNAIQVNQVLTIKEKTLKTV